MSWTDERIQELTRLWQAGHSASEIGKRLGVSKNSIVGKAHRLKLPSRPSPIKQQQRADADAAGASPAAQPVEWGPAEWVRAGAECVGCPLRKVGGRPRQRGEHAGIGRPNRQRPNRQRPTASAETGTAEAAKAATASIQSGPARTGDTQTSGGSQTPEDSPKSAPVVGAESSGSDRGRQRTDSWETAASQATDAAASDASGAQAAIGDSTRRPRRTVLGGRPAVRPSPAAPRRRQPTARPARRLPAALPPLRATAGPAAASGRARP